MGCEVNAESVGSTPETAMGVTTDYADCPDGNAQPGGARQTTRPTGEGTLWDRYYKSAQSAVSIPGF